MCKMPHAACTNLKLDQVAKMDRYIFRSNAKMPRFHKPTTVHHAVGIGFLRRNTVTIYWIGEHVQRTSTDHKFCMKCYNMFHPHNSTSKLRKQQTNDVVSKWNAPFKLNSITIISSQPFCYIFTDADIISHIVWVSINPGLFGSHDIPMKYIPHCIPSKSLT